VSLGLRRADVLYSPLVRDNKTLVAPFPPNSSLEQVPPRAVGHTVQSRVRAHDLGWRCLRNACSHHGKVGPLEVLFAHDSVKIVPRVLVAVDFDAFERVRGKVLASSCKSKVVRTIALQCLHHSR